MLYRRNFENIGQAHLFTDGLGPSSDHETPFIAFQDAGTSHDKERMAGTDFVITNRYGLMLLSFLGSSCRFFLTFLFFFQFKDLVGPIQIFLRINANAFEIRRENLDLGSRFQGT